MKRTGKLLRAPSLPVKPWPKDGLHKFRARVNAIVIPANDSERRLECHVENEDGSIEWRKMSGSLAALLTAIKVSMPETCIRPEDRPLVEITADRRGYYWELLFIRKVDA